MILWLAILGAWTVSFLFAGLEAGLLSVDPVRLRSHVKQRTAGAARLNRLLKHPERSLVTVLIVTNLANILGLLLLTKLLVASFAYAGFFIAGAAALPIYLFVLSVLPKSLFRRFPFRALAALGGVLEGASIVLWPFLEIGGRIGGLFLPRRATDRGRLFCGAGRIETDRGAKRTRRFAHLDRASHDPQRRRFSDRESPGRDGAAAKSGGGAAGNSDRGFSQAEPRSWCRASAGDHGGWQGDWFDRRS